MALLLVCGALALPEAGAAAVPPLCRGRPATIVGSAGDDHLTGTPEPDVIAGLGGNDTIEGGSGRDMICGGDGDDRLLGGPGRDVLLGGEGADSLSGGGGADRLVGGPGDDVLLGEREGDALFGGPGTDLLSGGGGADRLSGGPDRDRADGGPGLDACVAERRRGCGVTVAPPCPAGVGCGQEPASGVLDVPLVVAETSGLARAGTPVTSGVPLPRELGITDTAGLRLLDAAGRQVAAQFTPLARWGGAPDDPAAPLRWLLVDFQADLPAGGRASFRLVGSGGAAAAAPPLTVSDLPGAVRVETGAARFDVSRGDGRLTAPGLSEPAYARLVLPDGRVAEMGGPVEVEVTAAGPLRAAVEVSGWLRPAAGPAVLGYTARYWFYAGRAEVRLFLTVENRTACPLGEDAQISCQALDSAGSRRFADLSLVLPLGAGGAQSYSVGGETGPVSGALDRPLLLHQASSGTGSWDAYARVTDWDGSPLDARPRLQAYAESRGYRTTLGRAVVDAGDHAPGFLAVGGETGWWAVEVADFWEQFPKSLRAAPGGALEVGLFPTEYGPDDFAYTLRAGEHKTHEIWLGWSAGDRVPQGGRAPAAVAPAGWYVASGAASPTALPGADWPDYEAYLAAQLERAPAYRGWMEWHADLPEAIEATDFYGITDFGDWPIDYEGYGLSPLNLKYDAGLGVWLQWMRTGDARWRELAEAGNRHFADADVLHTLHSPRHWSDGIAFGHSYHDETGFENAHRNYGGTHPDTAFGPEGLLLTYYLTGYPPALEAALEVADCIEYRLRNDRHLCPYLGACSGEGWALEDGLYLNGERPAANSLSIVVEAYRATGDERYREVAEALVAWAAADAQPYLDGPDGTDRFLKPWALGLYLRALADYLEVLGEFDLPDAAGAEDSYLAYAGWLRDYALISLPPVESGPRAALPYEWWFDGRAENDQADVTNWLLLAADALAYAHHLGGDAADLEAAEALFRAGSIDPWYEGDLNTYSSTKETANAVTWGHTFLWEWAAAGG